MFLSFYPYSHFPCSFHKCFIPEAVTPSSKLFPEQKGAFHEAYELTTHTVVAKIWHNAAFCMFGYYPNQLNYYANTTWKTISSLDFRVRHSEITFCVFPVQPLFTRGRLHLASARLWRPPLLSGVSAPCSELVLADGPTTEEEGNRATVHWDSQIRAWSDHLVPDQFRLWKAFQRDETTQALILFYPTPCSPLPWSHCRDK